MNVPFNRIKSSTGVSFAGFFLAAAMRVWPDYSLAAAVAYVLVCCWVISPQYDRETLNDALVYFMRAAGISEAEQEKIRCCVYVPSGKSLKMVSDYMPGALQSTFITYMKHVEQSKGIVGRAYRLKESIIDVEPTQFQTPDDYVPYLKKWGFSDAEVALIDKTRKGFCAIPILKPKMGNTGKEKCVGVLYLDTLNPMLLSDPDDQTLIDRLESAAMLFEPILSLMTR